MTGVEPSVIAALVAGAGTVASMQAQQDAADERSSILNRQLMKTDEASDKAARLVSTEGEQYAPEVRETALNQQQEQTFQQGQKDLGSAASIIEGAGDAGNVSKDYLTAKADRALSEGQRLTAIARELAKTRAPGQLQTAEGLRRAGLTGELGSIWGSARSGANAAGLDAEGVQAPAYGNIGQIASAAAAAYGAGQTGQTGSGTDYNLTDAQLGQNAQAPAWWSSGGRRVRIGG